MKTQPLAIALIALAGLTAFVLWPHHAYAWKQTKTSTGASVHWVTLCHEYYVNEMGSDDVPDSSDIKAVTLSFKTWNDVDCSSITFSFAGLTNITTTGYFQETVHTNIVIWRENDWPYPQSPVAFTSVTYDKYSGEIYDADIELNGVDYRFTTKPLLYPNRVDIQNCVTHEAGHVLGLEHSENPKATMYSMAEPGEYSKRTLHQDDIDAVCTIYPNQQGLQCPEVEQKDLIVEETNENGDVTGCTLTHKQGKQSSNLFVVILVAVAITLIAFRCKQITTNRAAIAGS